jgi:hypothetical protein
MANLYEQLCADPAHYIDASYDQGYRLTPGQLDEIHLRGVQKRFAELRGKVPVLDRLAQEQSIDHIERVDDVVPLLFPHTV